MKYDNEHYILDYLDAHYEIKGGEFYFKPSDTECDGKRVIKSLTNLFTLNIDTVEFIVRGWAFNNGMDSKAWDSSVKHFRWLDIRVPSLPDQDCIDAYMGMMREAMRIPTEFLGGTIHHHQQQSEGRMLRGGDRFAQEYYMGVDTANSNSKGSIFVVHKPKFKLEYTQDDKLDNIRWEDYVRPEGQNSQAQITSFLEENGYGDVRWGRFGILQLVHKETIQLSIEPTFTWGSYKFYKRFAEGYEWWDGHRQGEVPNVGKVKGKISWNNNKSSIITRCSDRWKTLVVDNSRGRESIVTRHKDPNWAFKTTLRTPHEPWVRQ